MGNVGNTIGNDGNDNRRPHAGQRIAAPRDTVYGGVRVGNRGCNQFLHGFVIHPRAVASEEILRNILNGNTAGNIAAIYSSHTVANDGPPHVI